MNPFILHAERRAEWRGSKAVRRLLAATLIVLGWVMLARMPAPFAVGDAGIRFPNLPSFDLETHLIVGAFTLFLLRYLIQLGDRATCVDDLEKDHLSLLLQAPLSATDCFLDPLLFVCWKMRRTIGVLFALAAVWFLWRGLVDPSWRRWPGACAPGLFLCNLAVFSGIAAAAQWIAEWNAFVGRRWPFARWVADGLASIALALVAWTLALACLHFTLRRQYVVAALFNAVFLLGFGGLVFVCGRDTYRQAMSILEVRYAKAQPS
ncbi:MAG: hypothetical protein NTW86_26360 [Candidatus Sumerlaeota bacterium]|nr:hypothetical protein [Candidatus Sumerlaeota bacterium]